MSYSWSHVAPCHREVPATRKQRPAGETSESQWFHWENQSQVAAVQAPARHVNMGKTPSMRLGSSRGPQEEREGS